MGVLHQFHLVVGVPAEGLRDASGASLLEIARARAAAEYAEEGDQDVRGHLERVLPGDLRAFESGSAAYGGEARFVVGRAILELEATKGLFAFEVAGPATSEAVAAAARAVEEDLRQLRGAPPVRALLLGLTF